MLLEVSLGVASVAAFAGGMLIGSYKRLLQLARLCDQATADLDRQLGHRHDLVPSLAEGARGLAVHQHALLDALERARATALRAATSSEQQQAEALVTLRVSQVLAAVEPMLAHAPRLAELRTELAGVEQRIAAARRTLNAAVSTYNAALQQFPNTIVGRRSGLTTRRFFDLGLDRMPAEDALAFTF